MAHSLADLKSNCLTCSLYILLSNYQMSVTVLLIRRVVIASVHLHSMSLQSVQREMQISVSQRQSVNESANSQ